MRTEEENASTVRMDASAVPRFDSGRTPALLSQVRIRSILSAHDDSDETFAATPFWVESFSKLPRFGSQLQISRGSPTAHTPINAHHLIRLFGRVCFCLLLSEVSEFYWGIVSLILDK